MANGARVRSLVGVHALVNLQITSRHALLAAHFTRKPIVTVDCLHVVFQQPLRSESLVAVVAALEGFGIAELHVREFLEASVERLTAVSTTVEETFLEDLGVFVADVVREQPHMFGTFKAASVKRTKHCRRVEKQQMQFHFVFIRALFAVPTGEEIRIVFVVVQILIGNVSDEMIFIGSSTWNNKVPHFRMLFEMSHEIVLVAEHEVAVVANVSWHVCHDNIKVLVSFLMHLKAFVVLESDVTADLAAWGFPLIRMCLHVSFKLS